MRAPLEVAITLPKLYRKQAAAVCDPTRITCIESTTKAGKTIGCIVWQIGQVMSGPPDAEHWWVAPVYEQAMMAYRLAWSLLRHQQGFKQALAEKAILCPGGRRWSFRSADKPDNLFGSAVTSAVLDEASRMKDDAVDAIFSTTTRTRGPMRLIGNVRGRANRHYQWSRKGEAGEEGFAYHRITADDAVEAGVFHLEDVEMARRSMPDAIFRELYYCEPSDDGGNPFGIEAIRACAELNGGKATGKPVAVWGLDIARKRDWAVLIGLDHSRQVAALHRWHGLSPLVRWWARSPALWARAPGLAWSMMPRAWGMRWVSSWWRPAYGWSPSSSQAPPSKGLWKAWPWPSSRGAPRWWMGSTVRSWRPLSMM